MHRHPHQPAAVLEPFDGLHPDLERARIKKWLPTLVHTAAGGDEGGATMQPVGQEQRLGGQLANSS